MTDTHRSLTVRTHGTLHHPTTHPLPIHLSTTDPPTIPYPLSTSPSHTLSWCVWGCIRPKVRGDSLLVVLSVPPPPLPAAASLSAATPPSVSAAAPLPVSAAAALPLLRAATFLPDTHKQPMRIQQTCDDLLPRPSLVHGQEETVPRRLH